MNMHYARGIPESAKYIGLLTEFFPKRTNLYFLHFKKSGRSLLAGVYQRRDGKLPLMLYPADEILRRLWLEKIVQPA